MDRVDAVKERMLRTLKRRRVYYDFGVTMNSFFPVFFFDFLSLHFSLSCSSPHLSLCFYPHSLYVTSWYKASSTLSVALGRWDALTASAMRIGKTMVEDSRREEGMWLTRKAENSQRTSISKTACDIVLERFIFFFLTKSKNTIYFFSERSWLDRDAIYKMIDVFHSAFAVFREYWIR